jgi:hypothetical protein
MNTTPKPLDVLAEIEPHYLSDYLTFAGKLREFMNDTLSRAFKADPNPIRRQFHALSIIYLEYVAYEDAAAMLKSVIRWKAGETRHVLETLANYAPGEAVLNKVFEGAGLTSYRELYAAIGGDSLIPPFWSEFFPELDVKAALLHMCRFFFEDCATNHKELGRKSFNKLKHGPLAFSDGRLVNPTFQPVPSTLIPNPSYAKEGGNPYIIYGFEMKDSQIDERERTIHFTQRGLRLIIGCILSTQYPGELVKKWGGPREMWTSDALEDVLTLIREITVLKPLLRPESED